MSKSLTKFELAKQLERHPSIKTRKAAVDIIETLMDLIACHFQNGGSKVSIHGFGAFKTRKRRAFIGSDPRNGGRLEIPERLSITFKPSAEVIKRIN